MQKIEMISIDRLHPHPANPRKNLGDLTELAASIKAKGVLQNLTVVPYWSPVKEREIQGLYTVIIGHRRMAAAKLAGLTELPCVITAMTDEEQIETMAVENVQRSDLTPREQGECFQMMIDMGRSVSELSEKTGFSETTIRNRAKLAQLDKEKFKKAEARGATLTDYLKLNEIKDLGRRNKVLESIGTNDFNYRLQAAKKEEDDEQWLQETIEAFRNADWCEEISAEQRDELNGKFISYQHNYGPWNKRAVEKPKDAGNGKHMYLYFFFVGKHEVDLYREIKKSDKAAYNELSTMEQRRKQVAEQINGLMAECEDREQEFKTLRLDFIMDFDKFNTYSEEIMAFAVKASMAGDFADPKELATMLNIGYDEEAEEMDMKALDQMLRAQPAKVLLYQAYLMLEDGYAKWLTSRYDSTVNAMIPMYKKDEQQDLLYACLRSLGYAWSTEEQRASGGLLPQFQQAENLVKEFKEEVGNE